MEYGEVTILVIHHEVAMIEIMDACGVEVEPLPPNAMRPPFLQVILPLPEEGQEPGSVPFLL